MKILSSSNVSAWSFTWRGSSPRVQSPRLWSRRTGGSFRKLWSSLPDRLFHSPISTLFFTTSSRYRSRSRSFWATMQRTTRAPLPFPSRELFSCTVIFIRIWLRRSWSAPTNGAPKRTPLGDLHYPAPAGSYTIVAWHKSAGFFRQSVRLTEAQPTYVQFVIPIDEASSVNAVARR